MRPRNTIQAVLVHNEPDNDGNWVPLRLEVGSWVSLQPGKIGGHASDAKKHGGTSIRGSYKAKVLEFRVSPAGKSISAVRVQHAYMRRQLDLLPAVPNQDAKFLNCKFLIPCQLANNVQLFYFLFLVCIVSCSYPLSSRIVYSLK